MANFIDINSLHRNRSENPQSTDYLVRYGATGTSSLLKNPTTDYLPYNNILLSATPVTLLTSPAGTVYYQLELSSNITEIIDSKTNSYLFCPPPVSSKFYTNSYIDFPQSTVAGNYYPIVSYSPATILAAANIIVNATGLPALTNVILGSQPGLVRKTRPTVIVGLGGITITVSATGKTITLTGTTAISTLTVATSSNSVTGIRIYKIGNASSDSNLNNLKTQVSIVNNWNSGTGVITLNSNVTPFVGPTLLLEVFSVEEGLGGISYMGNQTNQASCYKYIATQLTLPNLDIITGNGGKIDSYPYIYLTFDQAGKSNSTNALYSNSKKSTKVTTRLAINAFNYQAATSFVALSSVDDVSIMYRPTDDMTFRLTLPNGELLTYRLPDNSPIYPPNPLVQTSLMLKIDRCDK